MKIILITGSEPRHACYANSLSKLTQLDGIIVEQKRQQIDTRQATSVVKKHHFKRTLIENEWFGEYGFPLDGVHCRYVGTGGANSNKIYEWIVGKNPDWIFLYGCSIIRNPLLTDFQGRILNVHMGLSPYYRGAATNFWPLVFGEPECIGATFHVATNRVDAGSILHQIRPSLSEKDNIHTIGNKVVVESCRSLKHILTGIQNGCEPVEQSPYTKTRTFNKNDFGEAALKKATKNLASGLLRTYLSSKSSRDKNFPISEMNHDFMC